MLLQIWCISWCQDTYSLSSVQWMDLSSMQKERYVDTFYSNYPDRKWRNIRKISKQEMKNKSIYYVSTFQIQYLVLSSFLASCFMVGLFLFVIFNIFPSTLQIIAGIFESNMCFGSIVSCLLLRRFITRESINQNNRNNTEMITEWYHCIFLVFHNDMKNTP